MSVVIIIIAMITDLKCANSKCVSCVYLGRISNKYFLQAIHKHLVVFLCK